MVEECDICGDLVFADVVLQRRYYVTLSQVYKTQSSLDRGTRLAHHGFSCLLAKACAKLPLHVPLSGDAGQASSSIAHAP